MKKISLPPFLSKLRKVCDTIDNSIAAWSDDGDQFIVKDSDRFEEHLQLYFKGNLQTFIRQLHFYCFRKVVCDNGKWSFSHPKFKKNKPALIYDIKRKTRNDNGDGVASQLEVKMLRNQVCTLQDSLAEVQKQMKEMAEEVKELRNAAKKRAAESSIFPAPADTPQLKRAKLDRGASSDSTLSFFNAVNMATEASSLPPVGMNRQTSLDLLPLVDFENGATYAPPVSTTSTDATDATIKQEDDLDFVNKRLPTDSDLKNTGMQKEHFSRMVGSIITLATANLGMNNNANNPLELNRGASLASTISLTPQDEYGVAVAKVNNELMEKKKVQGAY